MYDLLLALFLAQGAIAGTVRTDSTRTPVPYATVEILQLGRSTTADADGAYVFAAVPAGVWTVRASALGYIATERAVEVTERVGVRLDLLLGPDPLNVEGLRVRAHRPDAVGPPPVRIDLATVKRTPAYAEPDVLRAAQMIPAAQSISDFSSALYLRGGAPDQTLITLDGIPLFNPYHLGGLMSAFNPEAVESVEVTAGGLGAPVGDRLSGAVAIRTREAERDRFRYEGGLGLLSLRGTVAGPLPWGGGVVVSGRRTMLGLASAIHAPGMISKGIPHGFSDLLVRATHEIGDGGTVTATVYADGEYLGAPRAFRHKMDYDWDWGSRLAGVRFRYPLTAALQTEVRAAVSRFGTTLRSRWQDGLEAETTLDADGRMRDALAAGEAAWHGRIHTFRAGVQLDAYRFDYRSDRGTEPVGGMAPEAYIPELERTDELTTIATYAEEELRLHPAVSVRGGLRHLDAGRLGRAWLPRLGLRVDLGRGLTLGAAAGRHGQALHSLRSTEASLSSLVAYELYAVAPASLGLARSDEATAAISWGGGGTTVQIDAYVRRMEMLPLPPLPEDPLTAPVVVGDGYRAATGRARGVEVLVRHVRGEGGAWLSYALQESERTLDGQTFPPRFVRRHFLDGMVMVPISDRVGASARMMVGSGQPYTPVVGILAPTFLDPERDRLVDGEHMVAILGEHNSGRLRPYVRADVGFRHTIETTVLGRAVVLRPYAQVLNITLARNELNRARPVSVMPKCTYATAGGSFSCWQQNPWQLPTIVSLGVEWEH